MAFQRPGTPDHLRILRENGFGGGPDCCRSCRPPRPIPLDDLVARDVEHPLDHRVVAIPAQLSGVLR